MPPHPRNTDIPVDTTGTGVIPFETRPKDLGTGGTDTSGALASLTSGLPSWVIPAAVVIGLFLLTRKKR